MKKLLLNDICRRLASLLTAAVLLFGALPAARAAGSTITLGYLAAYDSKLNPFVCAERDLVSIGSLVYEPLFELDEHQQPQAVLAENWYKNDDGTWTITLRRGVLFHNGIELVAQDVVASYEIFRSADDNNPYRGRVLKIDELYAVDSFTLEMECDYSGMLALYCLTFPIVQRDTAYATIPMGTGPYWCVDYMQDDSIRLEANPLWWKQQPEIRALQFRHYWDVADMLTALQTGEIEMFQTRSTTAALTKKLDYASFMDYTTTQYELLIPNPDGIMGDLRLRQAIMYAIDYDTLMSNVYLDMAQQCEVPIHPSSWLYESRSAVYYYSPERAMQLLNESGWYDLTGDTLLNKVEDNVLLYIDVNILVYDEPNSKVRGYAAEQIAADLRAVGINATVEKLSRRDVRRSMEDGNFDLALVPLNLSEVPDLKPMFSENGSINYSVTATENLSALLNKCAEAENETDAKLAYSNLQTYIIENLPVMGVCFRTGMVLSTRPLTGLTGIRETDAYNGMEYLRED